LIPSVSPWSDAVIGDVNTPLRPIDPSSTAPGVESQRTELALALTWKIPFERKKSEKRPAVRSALARDQFSRRQNRHGLKFNSRIQSLTMAGGYCSVLAGFPAQ
jgi:hypothetical protein